MGSAIGWSALTSTRSRAGGCGPYNDRADCQGTVPVSGRLRFNAPGLNFTLGVMKAIGRLEGMSGESTAQYYRLINEEVNARP
jgi:hypothetical protein